jgi:hypothetical protein
MLNSSVLIIGLFVAIFIVNLITMILVIGLVKKKKIKFSSNEKNVTAQNQTATIGVVFCRNCGKQYDSTEAACPSCNTPR